MLLRHADFALIRSYVHKTAGIVIGEEKQSMVTSRLWRHVEKLGFTDFATYVAFLESDAGKAARFQMLDLLTTNETYFFRESAHFELLRNVMLPDLKKRPMNIWCAAASTGEEPYSIAMTLADSLGLQSWHLLATDISTNVLTKAERGIYRMERLDLMPQTYLKQYCRKGIDQYDGWMIVDRCLRARVTFAQHNLLKPPVFCLPEQGINTQNPDTAFDIIFLRNVLIYFDQATKQQVINNLVSVLRPGGWLITGHCESLNGINSPLQQISPSVYRRTQPVAQERLRLPA